MKQILREEKNVLTQGEAKIIKVPVLLETNVNWIYWEAMQNIGGDFESYMPDDFKSGRIDCIFFYFGILCWFNEDFVL